MPTWLNFGFQESLSHSIESISFFHDFSIIILIFIFILRGYFIFFSILTISFDSFITESHDLELIWTFLPVLFLIFLALPSMKVLYLIEEYKELIFSFKTIGHQWYWRYEMGGYLEEVDSFMENSNLSRLLKTRNILNLPINIGLRSVVSSVDVIHSWSVPSLGVKIDAIPGRLNQVFIFSNRSSIRVGQCSEICGANHSFIPIVLLFF